MSASSDGTRNPRPHGDDDASRWTLLVYLAPGTGIVAMGVSWLMAIPRIRASAEELGVELPAFTRLLVEHAGLITTVAALVATVDIVAIKLAARRALRIGISIAVSLIVFGLVAWDLVVFWMIYVATLQDVGS